MQDGALHMPNIDNFTHVPHVVGDIALRRFLEIEMYSAHTYACTHLLMNAHQME